MKKTQDQTASKWNMEREVVGGFGRSDECIQMTLHEIIKELIKCVFF